MSLEDFSLNDNLTKVILTVILLAFSGNPALPLFFGWEPLIIVLSVVLLCILLARKVPLFERDSILPLVVFLLLCLGQVLVFRFFPFFTIAGFFLRLFIGCTLIRLIGSDFSTVYVKVMVLLCQVSLFLWGAAKVGLIQKFLVFFQPLYVDKWSGKAIYTIVFQTYHVDRSLRVLRNSGMFWEPGAYAGYILLALVLLALCRNKLPRKVYVKDFFWLVTGLLSTFSTTGYLLLPLAVLLNFSLVGSTKFQKMRSGMLLYFGVCLVVGLVIVSYGKLEFIYDKIQFQIEKTLDTPIHDIGFNNTRFGSAIFDWEYIKRRPVIGWGLNERTRYLMHGENDRITGQGNGLTDFTAKFGLVGLILFGYRVYFGFLSESQKPVRSLFSLLVIFLTLIGETFLEYPLFLGLMFLKLDSVSSKKEEQKIIEISVDC